MTKAKLRRKILMGLGVLGFLLLLSVSGCFQPDEPPVALFWFAPASPYAGEQTAFNASASHDPDADEGMGIESFEWDFGDGTTGEGETVSHVYTVSGDFVVSLTVTDESGLIGTASDEITVAEAASNPPIAEIEYTPTNPNVDDIVAFSAAGSSDPARFAPKAIASYSWSFGDGATAQGSSVQHAYADARSYLVTLEVTDDDGEHDTAYVTVHVTDPSAGNTPPVAQFSFSPSSPIINQNVTFVADASYDPAAVGPKSIVLYSWDFGDGETAVGRSVVYRYSAAGTFEVRLTVSDDEGASDSEVKTVEVIDFVIPPPPPPPGG
jgi:PKD repeat protein